ncbi:Zinc knuckle domain containing protein [Coccidioides posadasii C735 delta SOWgp]|uniref:Zinc knuckle domain containing protein n=1 Tax=Coccidioides posadasii (strain C735) TaxID=222929 RepID=C5PCT1_COCP7|nr:Zinc knuckle domain containing protein [Coccidioides posadasii C735 delta SOWgp]EER24892.1 Zinc knuckle domain containing protein [Coccidioides posadasii C735 delta SOWgp]|eukprot:XP_003067037.1 Zinc knuckle domain containing protein [Coccidioides posadasii C735 delta SOWgp]
MAEGTTGSYATMSLGEDKRIVVHSHIPIPSPGTANAPWFDSRDATLFIERFYQMCKNHGVIDPKNIIEWLARYCVTWIGEWMKTLEGYKEGNWEVFSKEIIHEFHDQDITYKIHHQDYLQRLPEKLQNKVIDKAKLNLSDNMSPIDFRKVVQVTMDLINQYEENKKIFKEDEIKQKKMEKLGEQYQLANKPPTVEAPKKTASFVKTEESELKAKAKGSDSTNIEAAIEKMTNKFTNLALTMRVQSNQIQGNSNQYYMLQREGPPKPIPNYPTNVTVNPTTVQENTQLPVNPYLAQNGSPMTGYSSAHGQGGAQTGGISTHPSCFYCGKPGHHQSQCYEYQSDMSNGYCHIDDKENLHMGSKGQNYQAVTPKPGIPNMYIVRSMEEDEWVILESTSPKKEINQQEETSPANSISVKVQAGRLAYLMSDGESDLDKEYEPLEERTSVNVGTVGEAKNNQRAKIATPHTQCTGQFITYWDNQASVDDNVMEDIEPINQKKPEIQNKSVEKQRPRYSATDHLSSQICDSTDANELMG